MKLKIFVLNLDRHPDRLAHIGRALDGQRLDWQRFPAIDGSRIEPRELDEMVAPRGPIPRMPVGARACTASHIQMLKAFLATESDAALILEDDAEISKHLATDLPEIIVKSGAGILNVNRQPPSGDLKRVAVKSKRCVEETGYEVFDLAGIHFGTAGYVIDRKSAQVVLDEYPQPDAPIDHILFNANISRLFGKTPIRQLFPALVQPRSDLETSIQNARVSKSDSICNQLKRLRAEISIAPRLLAGAAIGYYSLKTLEFKE